MLVSQAHSFTRQARLAVTLAWVAGYTNVVVLLACGLAVSHMTGTASQWGLELVRGRWVLLGQVSAVLLAFVVGAVLATVLIELAKRRSWASIYLWPIAVEAALLGVLAVGLEVWGAAGSSLGPVVRWVLVAAGAMAMGLQNATVTRLSSGAVRTTHMTGVLTDLGHDLVRVTLAARDRWRGGGPRERTVRQVGLWLRAQASFKHLVLLLSIASSFALGAGLGALGFELAPRGAMIPPVLFLLWIIWQDSRAPIALIQEARADLAELALPEAMAVYHLRRRGGPGRQRLPDLLGWIERLPASKRVVVLDLGEVTALDDNAALELRAVVRLAGDSGRKVVIAGLDAAQYRAAVASGAGDTLDASNVCPDIELAIARGVVLASE
jgi:uncharacterized membrane protein YoaK (UPF0700 family)/anti-anti-sigma regulatory factor